MPLLKKKSFEKTTEPEFLRDNEEVFYCSITNEIFRDYEEFCERMFLCNSMVWTCSLTGKSNLTYAEALESEENAKKSLREFPSELKMPILYLASKTKRTGFADMADDVFQFAKDRYFIGENVETSFSEANKWKDAHVLQVIAPTDDQIKSALKAANNGEVVSHNQTPPASLYKYEIEHLDAFDQDISEMMIAEYHQVRRKKGSFSRDKCKLFLKQFVEQDSRGVLIIKPSEMENYKINNMTFDQMFDGPHPHFDASKKLLDKSQNTSNSTKKTKQESLDKFLTKSNNIATNGTNANTLERMKKKEEEFRKLKQQKKEEDLAMKQLKKEEELALKQKRKEEKVAVSEELKAWYLPKEDLELPDQRKLPVPTPVESKVPDEHYGDMLMVLEFVKVFSKILSTKDFFPNGLTVEIMERALTENEVAGPLIDLLQMLLSALFTMQEAETTQYKSQTQNSVSSTKQHEEINDIGSDMNVKQASRLATNASTWSIKHQGFSISRLPLYSLTTSEILRLHLLSSGAVINTAGARWRYQQRGGYMSGDDPGLYMRMHQPHILKALCTYNVVQLPIADKLQILSCLINQLLTYADVRDVVEEQLDNKRQAKFETRLIVGAEKRRKLKLATATAALAKEEVAKNARQYAIELNKIESESEKEKCENMRKLEEHKMSCYHQQILLGQDRAYRHYVKLESVPGFFVNFEDLIDSECLDTAVVQNPALIKGGREAAKAHIRDMIQANGIKSKLSNGLGDASQSVCSNQELFMCSADETCIVHCSRSLKRKWSFYHDNNQLDELINSLNCRGIRENALLLTLKNQKGKLDELIQQTPVHLLNPVCSSSNEKLRRSIKAKYEDANLGYPADMVIDDILQNALIENILEMEEKIYAGTLGSLNIKDREKWRNDLQNKNFKHFDRTLRTDDDEEIKREENASRPETPSSDTSDEKFASSHGSDPILESSDDVLSTQSETIAEAIRTLSIALAQIGQSVQKKYLKKPLGRIGTNRTDRKVNGLIGQWEKSLLAASSFSQIFLHYSTLDSCVMWARSVLVARCRICRRQNDSENMLLCDACNLGHHLYCLKPKLKSVPSGDWFCNKCQKEKQKMENVARAEPPPVKKRPIFQDEEIDDDDEESSDGNSDDHSVENNEWNDMDDEENDDDEDSVSNQQQAKIELCERCGSGGELISCEKCSHNYHIECVEPPLRRIPRGLWSCAACKKNNDKSKNDRSDGKVWGMNGQRRCAAKALYKIHDFAKSLRHLSDDSSEDEVISKRSSRREEGRADLPLHNAALHEVLSEIMKDGNAWPFLRPVQKNEVPDYYDVITKPMDFGTIKYKLNMGEYTEDAHFMSDALLVFQNCNTYNHTEDDVYKCGVQLLRHFQKKCRELGLKLPDVMDYNDDTRPRKKARTK